MRVAVAFRKTKIYKALVYELHTNPSEVYEAQESHQILDEHPVVNNILYTLTESQIR